MFNFQDYLPSLVTHFGHLAAMMKRWMCGVVKTLKCPFESGSVEVCLRPFLAAELVIFSDLFILILSLGTRTHMASTRLEQSKFGWKIINDSSTCIDQTY